MAKILIVDDDEQVRVYLGQVLREQGHEVHEVILAADGLVATDICHRQCPDLMILDLIMPGQEGLETIRLIRREHPDLPILAISGGGKMGDAEPHLRVARRLGANNSLAKPIMPDELIKAVGSLLVTSPRADRSSLS